jgi:4-amino-4-deoxy-L-arabinose transferase-like glycosyltransferase
VGLGAITAVGLVIRVANVALRPTRDPLAGDAFYYYFQARQLAAGTGFVNPFLMFKEGRLIPGADHPPGFTVFLAILQRLGVQSVDADRYALCLLGAVTVCVLGLLARDVIGPRAGLLAAGVAAVYPNLWMENGVLMSESLYVCAWTVALFFTYRFLRRGRTLRQLLGVSAALTVCATTRSEAVLLLPAILLPLCFGTRSLPWRRRIGLLALSGVVPLVVLGSWTIYNLGRFEHPVLLSTQFGPTLAATNCLTTYHGPQLGALNPACDPPYDGPNGDDGTVTDRAARARAKAFIAAHKSRVPVVVLAREGRLWGVFRVHQQQAQDVRLDGLGSAPLVAWTTRAYWVLSVLALAGMVIWHRRRLVLHPLLSQFAVTALAAALTTGITRLRAASEVGIVLLAAVSIDAGINWALRTRGAGRRRGPTEVDPDPVPHAASTI